MINTQARSSRSMVRQAHHERVELPLVLSLSKDTLRSNRSNRINHEHDHEHGSEKFKFDGFAGAVVSSRAVFHSPSRSGVRPC